MDNIRNKILEKNAQRQLNILKGIKGVDEFLKKGHMDFAGGKPSNSKLVEKKITDKRGHQTTRWVDPDKGKGGEEKEEAKGMDEDLETLKKRHKELRELYDKGILDDDGVERMFQMEEELEYEESENSESSDKTPEDWVEETSSEDLKKYLETGTDEDMRAIAEEELSNRGELEQEGGGERDSEGDEDLRSRIEQDPDGMYAELITSSELNDVFTEYKEDYLEGVKVYTTKDGQQATIDALTDMLVDGYFDSGEGEALEQSLDFNNPESVSAYISENKEAIMEMLLEDPNLNAATAAKIHNATNTGSEEVKAKVDAAQSALDDLKTSVGMDGESNEGEEIDDDSIENYITRRDPGGNLEYPGLKEFLEDNPNLKGESANVIVEEYSRVSEQYEDSENVETEDTYEEEDSDNISPIDFKPISEQARRAFNDAPKDTLIFENEKITALYSPTNKYLEILYNDDSGDFEQYEGIKSEQEAKEQVEEISRIIKEG